MKLGKHMMYSVSFDVEEWVDMRFRVLRRTAIFWRINSGVKFLIIYLKFLFYRTTQSVFTAAGVDVVDFADGTLKFKSRLET